MITTLIVDFSEYEDCKLKGFLALLPKYICDTLCDAPK